MRYLKGEQIKIAIPRLRQLIGQEVEILLKRDVDKSGRGYFFPKVRTITDVYRGQIEFDDGDWVSKSDIKEIAFLNQNNKT